MKPGPALVFLLLALLAQEASSTLAWADETMKVAYLERPPYYWTQDEQPKGFLLELTQRVFRLAGIDAVYMPVPPNRIIAELRENASPVCSIGWFKNPERESFARFSLPIYRDRPLVILTTKDQAERIRQYDRLEDVFRDTSLVLATMASFSFGEEIDRLQRLILPRVLTISTTQSVLPRLISQGRATYMLVAPEEVPNLLGSANVDPELFVELTMRDIPPGNLRHLIFNAGVPKDIVDRVNTAIRGLTDQDALLDKDANVP